MAEPNLTTDETRLVERYVSVCDFLSRCAQAIDEADWYYLGDKAAQLSSSADRLSAEANRLYEARTLRHGAVLAGVRWFGRHYRVSRLLHSARVELTTSEAGSIVLQVSEDANLARDDARLAEIIDSAGIIASRTDVEAATVLRVLATLRSFEVRDAE